MRKNWRHNADGLEDEKPREAHNRAFPSGSLDCRQKSVEGQDVKALPAIGFDRFVSRNWLDVVIDVAAERMPLAGLIGLLEQDIVGIEARSKTSIILNRMWLSPHSLLTDCVSRGVRLHAADPDIDTLALHWGSALRSHPFFASIAEFVGRLLHLHGELTAAQITRRLKEQYGDRASILRAAEVVLQTLFGWGIIKPEDPKARLFKFRTPVAVPSVAASAWLMEAAVASAGKSLRLSDRHLWLFPWALAGLLGKALTGTPLIPHQSRDGELWVTCAIN
jgi:hypothetical protein